LAVYPASSLLTEPTSAWVLNVANMKAITDNINALTADLVLARADLQAYPGVDHAAAQSTNIDDALQAIRHMIAEIGGETLWYTAPGASLKVHDHSTGKGGLIPWGSLGTSTARKVELHPEYRGAVLTKSLRGASPSGNNNITINTDIDVVSYVGRHYYEGISSQATLQDYYLALRFTLPIDFSAWASSNAIQIEYRTGSMLSTDCHVDVYVYKSGNGTVVTNTDNNTNTTWSNISFSSSQLGSWSANDIVELYIKLESRNSTYARIGKICFNYTA